MSKKQKIWFKVIPAKYKVHFEGLGKFRIAITKCMNKNEENRIKAHLDVQAYEIFDNVNKFTKATAKEFLKKSYIIHLGVIRNASLNNQQIPTNEDILNSIDKVTITQIIQEAILIREKTVMSNKKTKESMGVDFNIKQKRDSTVAQYKALLGYVAKFFGNDFDYKDLNREKIQQFRDYLINLENDSDEEKVIDISNSTINLYFRQLTTIFKNFIFNKELNISNPFAHWKPLVETKNTTMFTYQEIILLKDKLDTEQYFCFENLLRNGMRFEELCSIKKKHIQKNCFVFLDSKKHTFKRVVPIHKDVLEAIEARLKALDSEDYLFFTETIDNRVTNLRQRINKITKEETGKTLHKTRATFVTYTKNFSEGFNSDFIKSLTHSVPGIDNKSYLVGRDYNELAKIINNIDLKKLEELHIIA